MLVSFNWLKEFTEINFPPEELALRLTMTGLEVEGIHQREDDTILDINVTPNRADCLSIVGIAREISVITGAKLRLPQIIVPEDTVPVSRLASVEIYEPDLCQRYASRIIMDVRITESPEWIKKRLESSGLRPINNVVDITNYVLLEMGHPLHAFDYDRLEGRRIVVRRADEGERFLTLDGIERILDGSMLTIRDMKKAVAIAGVMGGLESEVRLTTKNVLLESAYFNPASVRRTSRRLGLKTESSYRFERGTDIEGVIEALERASELIQKITGGKVAAGRIDNYPKVIQCKKVRLRINRINKILGTTLSETETKKILKSIGTAITEDTDGTLNVTPPSFRGDLNREIDLIEEIARIFGYENIPTTTPQSKIILARDNNLRRAMRTVRMLLKGDGFTEVINYSFIGKVELERLYHSSEGHPKKSKDFLGTQRYISLRNPLNEEQAIMRTTLIPGLLKNAVWNINREAVNLRIFEIGKVFHPINKDSLPYEPVYLSGLLVGQRSTTHWSEKTQKVDFFDMKGTVEMLMQGLRIKNHRFIPSEGHDLHLLHPGRSARVWIKDSEIGYLGEVHPDVAESYGINENVYIFEIDFSRLVEYSETKITFKQIPRFPSVKRDMAIFIPIDLPADKIIELIMKDGAELIEEVHIFDLYTGSPVPEGKKSLAFSIRYRSKNRSLTDEEVNALHQQVSERLKNEFGAEMRG